MIPENYVAVFADRNKIVSIDIAARERKTIIERDGEITALHYSTTLESLVDCSQEVIIKHKGGDVYYIKNHKGEPIGQIQVAVDMASTDDIVQKNGETFSFVDFAGRLLGLRYLPIELHHRPYRAGITNRPPTIDDAEMEIYDVMTDQPLMGVLSVREQLHGADLVSLGNTLFVGAQNVMAAQLIIPEEAKSKHVLPEVNLKQTEKTNAIIVHNEAHFNSFQLELSVDAARHYLTSNEKNAVALSYSNEIMHPFGPVVLDLVNNGVMGFIPDKFFPGNDQKTKLVGNAAMVENGLFYIEVDPGAEHYSNLVYVHLPEETFESPWSELEATTVAYDLFPCPTRLNFHFPIVMLTQKQYAELGFD